MPQAQNMQKKPQKPKLHQESIEAKYTSVNAAVTGISNAGLDSIWKDLLGAGSKDLIGQVFGAELKPGQPQSLKKEKPKEEKKPVTEAHMEYFRTVKNADIAPAMQKDASIDRQVNDIRLELKKLVAESKQLESVFKTVQLDQKIVKAGVYHQNLLEFVKTLIHAARASLKEGATWMNTAKSKKQQQQYKSMAKKHGTSFTLNNERTAATQTG